MSNYDWMDSAVCAQTDPAPFYPETGGEATLAKNICGHCPVQDECRAYAMRTGERNGIWGGLAFARGSTTRPAEAPAPTNAAKADRDARILRLHKAGLTPTTIARAVGCDPRTVHRATAESRSTKAAA